MIEKFYVQTQFPDGKGEPWEGIRALFNGDLHAGCPTWAPREDWVVLGPNELGRIIREEDAE